MSSAWLRPLGGPAALLHELAAHRICLPRLPGLPPPQAVRFDPYCRIEPYVQLTPSGAALALCTCGSFTYSGSPLPAELSMGRYCSIAEQVAVYGGDHAMERISTAPFTTGLPDYLPFWRTALAELGGGRTGRACPASSPAIRMSSSAMTCGSGSMPACAPASASAPERWWPQGRW